MSSWFSELAGKAEEFLNRFDEEANKVLSVSDEDEPPSSNVLDHDGVSEKASKDDSEGKPLLVLEKKRSASLVPKLLKIQNSPKTEAVINCDQDLLDYLNSSSPGLMSNPISDSESDLAVHDLTPDVEDFNGSETVPSLIDQQVTNHSTSPGLVFRTPKPAVSLLKVALQPKPDMTAPENAGQSSSIESASSEELVADEASLKCELTPLDFNIITEPLETAAVGRNAQSSGDTEESFDIGQEQVSDQVRQNLSEPKSIASIEITDRSIGPSKNHDRSSGDLDKKHTMLEQELVQLRTALQQAAENLKKKEAEIYRVSDQLAENCGLVDKMRREKKVMEGKIRELEDNESRKGELLSQAETALKLEKQSRIDENMIAKGELGSLTEELKSVRERCDSEAFNRSQEQNQLKAVVEKKEKELAELNLSFEEYKAKAQRILSSKDKLIGSLKSFRGQETTEVLEESPELQEAREEILLLKEELSILKGQLFGCQRHLNDLEKEVAEGGNREQELKEKLKAQEETIRDVVEDRQRTAQELVLFQKEMSSQKSNWMASMAEKEAEIGKLTALSRGSTSPSPPPLHARNGVEKQENKIHALSQSLLQKQTLIENLTSQCNSLHLQLERMEEHLRRSKSQSAPIPLTDDAKAETSSDSPWQSPNFSSRGRYATWIDRGTDGMSHIGNLMLYYLRRYPTVRLAAIGYAVLLHIWVLIVLLTYKPEIHDENFMIDGAVKAVRQ